MNPEVKELWLAALRSGEYKQGTGALKREAGGGYEYCCLGVLCQLAADHGITRETGSLEGYMRFGGNVSYLPEKVSAWAGVESRGRLPRIVEGSPRLIELNDRARYSFEQIADVIEEQF